MSQTRQCIDQHPYFTNWFTNRATAGRLLLSDLILELGDLPHEVETSKARWETLEESINQLSNPDTDNEKKERKIMWRLYIANHCQAKLQYDENKVVGLISDVRSLLHTVTPDTPDTSHFRVAVPLAFDFLFYVVNERLTNPMAQRVAELTLPAEQYGPMAQRIAELTLPAEQYGKYPEFQRFVACLLASDSPVLCQKGSDIVAAAADDREQNAVFLSRVEFFKSVLSENYTKMVMESRDRTVVSAGFVQLAKADWDDSDDLNVSGLMLVMDVLGRRARAAILKDDNDNLKEASSFLLEWAKDATFSSTAVTIMAFIKQLVSGEVSDQMVNAFFGGQYAEVEAVEGGNVVKPSDDDSLAYAFNAVMDMAKKHSLPLSQIRAARHELFYRVVEQALPIAARPLKRPEKFSDLSAIKDEINQLNGANLSTLKKTLELAVTHPVFVRGGLIRMAQSGRNIEKLIKHIDQCLKPGCAPTDSDDNRSDDGSVASASGLRYEGPWYRRAMMFFTQHFVSKNASEEDNGAGYSV